MAKAGTGRVVKCVLRRIVSRPSIRARKRARRITAGWKVKGPAEVGPNGLCARHGPRRMHQAFSSPGR